ncbi:MAG: PdxA family dehydrogenase [Elusimicrobiota bacterium]
MKEIFITAGDPRGIGPEIICKSLDRLAKEDKIKNKIVIGGSRDDFEKYAGEFNLEFDFDTDKNNPGFYLFHIPRSGDPATDCLNYLEKGIEYCKQNPRSALVTAPVRKDEVARIQPGFTGHTGYLAQKFNQKDVVMSFVTDRIKMSLLTTHISLKEVSSAITVGKILTHVRIVDRSLRENFGIEGGRLVLASLNPHGGESGLLGTEEETVFKRARDRLEEEKINISGPYSPEKVLKEFLEGKYDFIVSPYHDQFLPAVKYLLGPSVNYTMGLPVIRTSPDHGPALDIAGKDKARPDSFLKAIELAFKLAEGN